MLVGLDRLDLDAEPITEEEIPRKFGWDYDSTIRHKNMSLQEYMKTLPWFKRVQPRVWQLFEEPYSSSAAKVTDLSATLNCDLILCFLLGYSSCVDLFHPRVHYFLLFENSSHDACTHHLANREQLHQYHTHLHPAQRENRSPRSISIHRNSL